MAKAKQQIEVPAEPEQTYGPGKVTVAVFKGDRMIEATRIKMNAMSILTGFVKRVRPDAEVLEDDNCIVVTIPGGDGDPGWVENRVCKYVSLVGSGYNRETIEAKIDQMVDLFEKAGGTPDKVGAGLLVTYLNRYYLIQRSASVFRRE